MTRALKLNNQWINIAGAQTRPRKTYEKSTTRTLTSTTPTTPTEALNYDITEDFWETIQKKIEYKLLNNIGIIGEVRTHKSTIGVTIQTIINKTIEKTGRNKNISGPGQYKYIFSDQTEFLRYITNPTKHVCILIDEFNAMARTGLNATTETKQFDNHSDVFAGEYQHKISISPDMIQDDNVDIVLETIASDHKTKQVLCACYYRDPTHPHLGKGTPIGTVTINVSKTIKNWEEEGIRDLVEQKSEVTEEEQQKIDHWMQKDPYIRYQVKKFKRFKLLKEHGVRDIREPEFALPILATIQEAQDICKLEPPVVGVIKSIVDMVCRDNKRIYSYLVLNEIAQKAAGILILYHKVHKLDTKRTNPRTKQEDIPTIEKAMQQLKDMIHKLVTEQKKLKNIYEDYLEIK